MDSIKGTSVTPPSDPPQSESEETLTTQAKPPEPPPPPPPLSPSLIQKLRLGTQPQPSTTTEAEGASGGTESAASLQSTQLAPPPPPLPPAIGALLTGQRHARSPAPPPPIPSRGMDFPHVPQPDSPYSSEDERRDIFTGKNREIRTTLTMALSSENLALKHPPKEPLAACLWHWPQFVQLIQKREIIYSGRHTSSGKPVLCLTANHRIRFSPGEGGEKRDHAPGQYPYPSRGPQGLWGSYAAACWKHTIGSRRPGGGGIPKNSEAWKSASIRFLDEERREQNTRRQSPAESHIATIKRLKNDIDVMTGELDRAQERLAASIRDGGKQAKQEKLEATVQAIKVKLEKLEAEMVDVEEVKTS